MYHYLDEELQPARDVYYIHHLRRHFAAYATFKQLREAGLRSLLHVLHQMVAVTVLLLGPLMAIVMAPFSAYSDWVRWHRAASYENFRQYQRRLAKSSAQWANARNIDDPDLIALCERQAADLALRMPRPFRSPMERIAGAGSRRLWVILAATLGAPVAFVNLMIGANELAQGNWTGLLNGAAAVGVLLIARANIAQRP